MKKEQLLFFIGLLMFMSGIYLSTHWAIIGTIIGISGGLILGISSYFSANKKIDQTK
ncbi:hypothetical protein [Niallia nealsonii]|uniref:hypothetical protein n=1 Tax=Niallia nealsonii TaxID=115979 RepID=UPI001448A2C5|nr:hypothetical protein [Niallia nealsonii]